MIRLREARVRACRSVEDIFVRFPERGLVLLKAKNLQTGGSSAAGKSSLLDGIAYALDCSPLPSTELQSWSDITDEKLSVEVTLEGPKGIALVTRGHGAGGQLDGEKFKGASGATRVLKEVLAIDSELLQLLTYRAQGVDSVFLSLDDKDKREMLGRAIPMVKQVEKLAEDTAAAAKEATLKATVAVSALTMAQTQLADEEKSQSMTPAPSLEEACAEKSLQETKVAAFTKNLERATDRLSVVQRESMAAQAAVDRVRHADSGALEAEAASLLLQPIPNEVTTEEGQAQSMLTECRLRITAADDADRKMSMVFFEKMARFQQEKHRHQAFLDHRSQVERERGANLKALESLRQNTCPTCKQSWCSHAESEAQLVADIATADEVLARMEATSTQLRAVQAELDAMVAPQRDPVIAQLREVETKLLQRISQLEGERSAAARVVQSERTAKASQLRQRAAELDNQAREQARSASKALEIKTWEANGDVNHRREELEQARAALQRAEYESTRALDRETRLRRLDDSLRERTAEAVAALAKANFENDLAEAVGRQGFFGAIFAEILAEVSADVNQVLGAVPNTAQVTLTLEADTGSRKAITPIVTVRGNQGPMRSALSGGMRAVVMLAIDLSFGAVVCRRTGATPGWLFLDEPFDGLGPVEKESAIEVLRNHAQDRLIVVVDHASETKELFDQVIELEFDGRITRVV